MRKKIEAGKRDYTLNQGGKEHKYCTGGNLPRKGTAHGRKNKGQVKLRDMLDGLPSVR